MYSAQAHTHTCAHTDGSNHPAIFYFSKIELDFFFLGQVCAMRTVLYGRAIMVGEITFFPGGCMGR